MDTVSLVISVFALLIAAVTGFFYLESVVSQTRKDFYDNQPNLRITKLSSMNSGDVITLFPEIENVGRGVAYDCTLLMDGGKGNFGVKKIHPAGPRFQKHMPSIILGPEAPIRHAPFDNGCLRLQYKDRWGQEYEVWYRVTQVRDGQKLLYNVQIDLDHPGMTEPSPSFFEMRKFLRNISLYD